MDSINAVIKKQMPLMVMAERVDLPMDDYTKALCKEK